MEMFADSGTGAMPEVHSDVESFGSIESVERAHAPLRQLHHFSQLDRLRFIKARCVYKRGNHEVTGCVRKQVQDQKVLIAAIKDQPVRILGSIISDTEDARVRRLSR